MKQIKVFCDGIDCRPNCSLSIKLSRKGDSVYWHCESDEEDDGSDEIFDSSDIFKSLDLARSSLLAWRYFWEEK